MSLTLIYVGILLLFFFNKIKVCCNNQNTFTYDEIFTQFFRFSEVWHMINFHTICPFSFHFSHLVCDTDTSEQNYPQFDYDVYLIVPKPLRTLKIGPLGYWNMTIRSSFYMRNELQLQFSS